jgi:arylsulfatase A-like enzyme
MCKKNWISNHHQSMTQRRNSFFRPLATALFAVLLPTACIARPNIVIFLADDQGWGDIGGNGNMSLNTPHIDSLADQGASIQHFFVCPVCAPTRAEFLTGRHSGRTGVRGVTRGEERINADEQTIADVFKSAGYATGIFGKWHNGSQAPYHPNSRGFDEFYGFTSGHWGHYFSPELEHNTRIVKGDGYVTDDFTNKAIKFIEKNKDAPFFCYIPYCTPHSPMQVPDTFWNRFKEKEIKQRPTQLPKKGGNKGIAHNRAALAMVENVDWNVGRVLKRLDELNLSDNTIVIYFSDNGPNGRRWNGGFRGIKGSLDDGGTRSVFNIRWPGRIKKGHRVSQIASVVDLLPTLAATAGIKLNSPQPLDGKNLSPLLFGEVSDWPDRFLFGTKGWGRKRNGKLHYTVRSQRYRYSNNGELHDVTTDPGQTSNIAKQHPAIVKKLKDAGDEYLAQVTPIQGQPDTRPIPVGVAPVTHLPARDGKGTGGVTWSSRHPNCSFFTHWSTPEQSMVWPVEVARAGDYEVIVHYTCPKNDIGSTLELSAGVTKVRAKLTEPFEPPLLGADHDRVPRQESYYKDFKPLTLGVIHLSAGPTLLTLRASHVAGKSVADIRRLVLRRK